MFSAKLKFCYLKMFKKIFREFLVTLRGVAEPRPFFEKKGKIATKKTLIKSVYLKKQFATIVAY